MKNILENIGIILLIIGVLYASRVYYHARNPVEHAVERVILNHTGIGIENFISGN